MRGRLTAHDAPEDGVLEVQVVRALVQDEELRRHTIYMSEVAYRFVYR